MLEQEKKVYEVCLFCSVKMKIFEMKYFMFKSDLGMSLKFLNYANKWGRIIFHKVLEKNSGLSFASVAFVH